ncbi:hypothetical protein WN59_09445 [Salinicoccus sediminis]|uniref:DUF998 domain-containing protein n=1 Tax=Salinicoccus sediminis TaxID=1432562 RepID=A0A0M2SMR1_9STAP|nr:hypothetical protein WN59_09445 [Salinicoccus sediminis]
MLLLAAFFIAKRGSRTSDTAGFMSWILLIFYFPVEWIVTSRMISAYSFMNQPMSDLGVERCMSHAYSLAPYHICSPLSGLMNITFIVTGILIALGAVLLHRFFGEGIGVRIATGMWVVYGLGYSISGIFPADVNFSVHTIFSLPGMVLQIPAMLIIAKTIRDKMPGFSVWTYICAALSALSLVLIVIGFAPGLMQRLLYGFVWLWMIVGAIILWRTDITRRA